MDLQEILILTWVAVLDEKQQHHTSLDDANFQKLYAKILYLFIAIESIQQVLLEPSEIFKKNQKDNDQLYKCKELDPKYKHKFDFNLEEST